MTRKIEREYVELILEQKLDQMSEEAYMVIITVADEGRAPGVRQREKLRGDLKVLARHPADVMRHAWVVPGEIQMIKTAVVGQCFRYVTGSGIKGFQLVDELLRRKLDLAAH